jgi:hypothetical protein
MTGRAAAAAMVGAGVLLAAPQPAHAITYYDPYYYGGTPGYGTDYGGTGGYIGRGAACFTINQCEVMFPAR